MEVSSHSPPENLDTHIRGLLDRLGAAKELISIKTGAASAPTKSTNIYYPQATSTSPNLSHLPLPPNLSILTIIRVIPSNATSTIKQQRTHRSMAFELSTPPALLQSVHYYFPTHFGANLAAGLYPTFSEVSLLVATNASKYSTGKENLVQVPISGALSNIGSGGEMYMERFLKEALGGRLRGVAVHVEWRSRAQEAAEQWEDEMVMAPRPRRRQTTRRDLLPLTEAQARRRREASVRNGVFMPTAVDLGDGDEDEDRMQSHMRRLLGRGAEHGLEYENGQEVEVGDMGRQIRVVGHRPTFGQFLGATAPPGLMEAIEGLSGLLDVIEAGVVDGVWDRR